MQPPENHPANPFTLASFAGYALHPFSANFRGFGLAPAAGGLGAALEGGTAGFPQVAIHGSFPPAAGPPHSLFQQHMDPQASAGRYLCAALCDVGLGCLGGGQVPCCSPRHSSLYSPKGA